MNFKNIARESERLIRDFDIRTPSRYTSLKSLSSGNIQKLILARELSRNPSVLVAAQSTRGLDISAVVKRNGVSVEELGLMMGGAHRHNINKI